MYVNATVRVLKDRRIGQKTARLTIWRNAAKLSGLALPFFPSEVGEKEDIPGVWTPVRNGLRKWCAFATIFLTSLSETDII